MVSTLFTVVTLKIHVCEHVHCMYFPVPVKYDVLQLTCESVHECLQRTADHLKERISDWILVRATQSGVL